MGLTVCLNMDDENGTKDGPTLHSICDLNITQVLLERQDAHADKK